MARAYPNWPPAYGRQARITKATEFSSAKKHFKFLAFHAKVAQVLSYDELRHGVDMTLEGYWPVQVRPGPVFMPTLRAHAFAAHIRKELPVAAQRYVPQAGRHAQAAGNSTSSS